MGVALTSILEPEPVAIGELAHRVIAVDAYNMLYQFLTTIRMRDGTPLKNSKGEITSHLVGLFNRTSTFLEHNLKLVFVYDGETPELKGKETARRKQLKEQAAKKHAEAEKADDIEGMRKYAGRTAVLTKSMVRESQELLEALGIPWIQAPAEAEAQAAHLVKRGDAELAASQDNDLLLFGAPKMLKNLSITGKRKRPGTSTYYTIEPEIITLNKELKRLGINQQQLIALGILVGTDFNPKGIKGLGPKRSLDLVKKHGDDLKTIFAEAEWDEHFDLDWQRVYDTIAEMPVTDDYEISWKQPDEQALQKLLVERFEFSEDRVKNTLQKLASAQQQKGLGEYF